MAVDFITELEGEGEEAGFWDREGGGEGLEVHC